MEITKQPETKTETKKRLAIRAQIREKTTGYILTALGLVAGLAWNDAISSFIKSFFPLDTNGVIAKFVYAGLVTVVIVIISNSLLRVLEGKDESAKS